MVEVGVGKKTPSRLPVMQHQLDLADVFRSQERHARIEQGRSIAVNQKDRHGTMAQHIHTFGNLPDLINAHLSSTANRSCRCLGKDGGVRTESEFPHNINESAGLFKPDLTRFRTRTLSFPEPGTCGNDSMVAAPG